MLTRKIAPWLFAALGSVTGVGCGAEAVDEANAHPVGSEEVAVDQEELLGEIEFGDSTCSPSVQSFFRDAHFVARTVVASEAFEACVRARIPAQYFFGCGGDPAGGTALQTQNALVGARSVNDMQLSCDPASGNWGSAFVRTNGFYEDERVSMEALAIGAAGAGGRYPEDIREVAATLIHENLHQHGYNHCGGVPAGKSDLVWLIDNCALDVVNQSMATCGDICPTRAGEDISSCRERGRLELVEALGSPSCVEAHDAGKGGVAALQLVGSDMRPLDQFPHGPRWGRGTAFDGWINGHLDQVRGTGNLVPESTGSEMVVRSGWGLGVIGWQLRDGTLTERTATRAGAPFGSVLSHHGPGTGTWTLGASDLVLSVGRFSNSTQFAGLPSRDEVLVRGPGGIALLAVVSGQWRARAVLGTATTLSGTFGSFTWRSTDPVLATGDFNGDGQKDILVRNGASGHVAVISRTGSTGGFVVLDVRPITGLAGFWGGWDIGGADTVVAVGDFINDGGEELLVRSGARLGLVGMPDTGSRLQSYWLGAFGTTTEGGWTLRASDTFHGAGHFHNASKKAVLIRGASGIAPLRWRPGATATGFIATFLISQHRPATGGFYIDPAGGHWAYAPIQTIEAFGDFNGDGLDEFVIKSGWGIGVIGRTAASTDLIVHDAMATECGDSTATACHSGLWGDWLVQETDKVIGVLPDGISADTLLVRSAP